MDGLAGSVDAAVGPGESVERPGIGLALDAAIGQVEGGRGEVERDEVFAHQAVDALRRLRPGSAQEGGAESDDAIGIGRGLGQDVVVARE